MCQALGKRHEAERHFPKGSSQNGWKILLTVKRGTFCSTIVQLRRKSSGDFSALGSEFLPWIKVDNWARGSDLLREEHPWTTFGGFVGRIQKEEKPARRP